MHELWQFLRDGFFIDAQTDTVTLALATHNPDTDSMAHWSFRIRQLPSGSFRAQARVSTAPMATARLTAGAIAVTLSLLLVVLNAAVMVYLYVVKPGRSVASAAEVGIAGPTGEVGSSATGRSQRPPDWGLTQLTAISTVSRLWASDDSSRHPPPSAFPAPVAESADTTLAGVIARHVSDPGTGVQPMAGPPVAVAAGCDGRNFHSRCDASDPSSQDCRDTVLQRDRQGMVGRQEQQVVAGEEWAHGPPCAWTPAQHSTSAHGHPWVGHGSWHSPAAVPVAEKVVASSRGASSYGGASSSRGAGSSSDMHARSRGVDGDSAGPPMSRGVPGGLHGAQQPVGGYGWMAMTVGVTAVALVVALAVEAHHSALATGLLHRFRAAQSAADVTVGTAAWEHSLMHAYHDVAAPVRRLLPAKTASPALRRAALQQVVAAHESSRSGACEVAVAPRTQVADIVAARLDVPLWALPDEAVQVQRFADVLVRSCGCAGSSCGRSVVVGPAVTASRVAVCWRRRLRGSGCTRSEQVRLWCGARPSTKM